MTKIAALLTCVAFLIGSSAHAERADRDKPVNLEADRITVDDAQKVQTLDGKVQLMQGTLVIRTEKLVVTQDAEGFQKGIAHGGEGGLARFRQKREGKAEFVEGEAERIEYESRAEKAQFFGRALVKSGLDEVRGQYIAYDGKTERYVVTSGPDGASAAAAGKPDRVRAVIQSKSAKLPPPAPPRGVDIPLAPATDIGSPRAE
jgi:lipopolysaccharide export system protein LptA